MHAAPIESRLPQRRLVCARCGAGFDCGSGGRDGGCWCMEAAFRLPMPGAAQTDCLCPACLRTAAMSQAIGHSP